MIRNGYVTWSLISFLFAAGCTRPFHAALPANAVPGSPRLGHASTNGLSIDVEIDSWQGDPSTLTNVLTPVKMKVNNEGEHAVVLRYRDFTLSNPEGTRSAALPPFEIQGTVNTSPVRPAFPFRNYMLYPSYGFYGPGFAYWPDYWGWDPGWYDSYYGYWQRNLPTQDMLEKAIPEGMLNPGGSVEGYLYFPHVPSKAKSVEFQATLMEAQSHERFGTLLIPFQRKE